MLQRCRCCALPCLLTPGDALDLRSLKVARSHHNGNQWLDQTIHNSNSIAWKRFSVATRVSPRNSRVGFRRHRWQMTHRCLCKIWVSIRWKCAQSSWLIFMILPEESVLLGKTMNQAPYTVTIKNRQVNVNHHVIWYRTNKTIEQKSLSLTYSSSILLDQTTSLPFYI